VAKLPAEARLRFVSQAAYDTCFAPAESGVLPDGLHLYRLDPPTASRLECLAANWQDRS
jgi:hypothetical protein